MRLKSFCLILIVIGIGFSSSSIGQQAELPKRQISASEILRKNLIATGGLEAHKALTTLVASGEIHLDATHPIGEFKFSYKAPGSDMLKVRMFGHGANWVGHRGGRPVSDWVNEGLRPTAPSDELCLECVINGVNTWIVEDDWRKLLQWDFSRDYNIELIGVGEVDKRLAYGLRFTPKKGGNAFVCFYDRETFLLVRIDRSDWFRTRKNQEATVHKVESIFRGYHAEGGIQLPSVIAIPRPEGDVVFEVGKIKAGEPVKDSVFE
jgi:hypothetical protein